MSEYREPNLFSMKTKILVGVPLAIFVVVGLVVDPELYQSVVGALTLPVAIAFPLVYMTLPWKRTVLGRALMTKARAVALLYIVGVTGTYIELPFDGYLMGIVATYLAIGLSYQFIVLLRIKFAAIREQQKIEAMS